ncbi:sporulation protein YpjB [Paenibacillus sacheonensis]|uniref:Sporulation protein n=1 Tax=Paenibacillus sacheonensis TaxID=742054 RepID=A0A7X4YP99_9BACL|nr:sporulation protein YpjB [Paenibacillus sacheonensis]MBM7564515.1 hypothetical protein [Paenibacillus sacheonensis]NBC69074.1 hypothetical protein [Paenibacillus sacheonensis]
MKASSIYALACVGVILVLVSSCSLNDKPNFTIVKSAIGAAAEPSESAALEQLSSWSDALYAAANQSNRQEAYLLLQRIEELAATDDVRKTGTPAGWHAFDLSLQAAKKAMSEKGTTTLWYTEAARLKLASDAVNRPEAPLWLQYEGVLRDDSQRILTAWQSQIEDRAMAAEAAIGIYGEHLDRLEVAALMQRDAGELEAVRERLDYMKEVVKAVGSGQLRHETVNSALDRVNASASALFKDPSDEGEPAVAEAIPPGVTVGQRREGSMQLAEMFIAAFVMGVLGFAGWRKYRGGQEKGIPISRNKFNG